MQGYQITFFTESNRRFKGQPVGEWLVSLAKHLQLEGATLRMASEGFGKSGRIHASHFFELAEQPVEVMMMVTAEQGDALFRCIEKEDVRVFYVKVAADFGRLGKDS